MSSKAVVRLWSVKSRATARHAFESVLGLAHHYLFEEVNGTRHGTADGSPDDLWECGRAQFGSLLTPVKYDLAFLISTAVPIEASLDGNAIRVAYRKYTSEDLRAIRRPIHLDAARLDPGDPTVLYVKVKGEWFITKARDHSTVHTLTPEGQFLENYRPRRNAAAARGEGCSSKERMARRIEQLERSVAAHSSQEVASKPEVDAENQPASEQIDLETYADIPFVK